MKIHRLAPLAFLTLVSSLALAEDVRLPAPVLQWSFYIFLLFALAVVVGIFFVRTREGLVNEPLSSLKDAPTSPVYSVEKNTPVRDCVGQMIEHGIGAILVMDQDRLVGIFSERDCMQRVVGAGLDPDTTLVRDVMTENPYCVSPETSLSDAMAIVTNYRIRHLPVVENDRVLGMVSSGDLILRLASASESDLRKVAESATSRNG